MLNSTPKAPVPVLPQNDSPEQQKQRAFDTSLAKTSYNYMFSYLEPIPISADLPKGEAFTPAYEAKVLQVFLPLIENFKDVVIGLLKKELQDDLPSAALSSVKAVEVAYEKLKQDKKSSNPLKIVTEVEDIKELLHALSKVPKELESVIKAVARLPEDLLHMVEGFGKIFKQFETEGFTAFLKNTLYDMLDSGNGRDYLKAKSIKDYANLLSDLGAPENLQLEQKPWMIKDPEIDSTHDITQQDWYFGYCQIGGFNTTNLKAVSTNTSQATESVSLTELQAKMPLSDKILQSVTGDSSLSLEQATQDGLLYVCDYEQFEGLEGSELHDLKRYPAAPIAVFYWNPNPPKGFPTGGALQPIAIQLGQSFDENKTPIFTPNDCANANDENGVKWQIAKLIVQNTCAIQHETVAHLGACHLVIEPMVVAANRQLAQTHPLMVLLKPHFRFTLDINNGAIHSLIVPGGVVASVLSTSIQSSGELIVKAHEKWRFDKQNPEVLFEQRGVSDKRLPSFPFREDTLELWAAIKQYVRDYLELYYQGSTDDERNIHVKEDYELQNWINEMVNPKYAAIKGMDGLVETGEPDKPYAIDDFAYLVEVVALIIYTASAQHAAVNYAQYPLMSYIPSVTGSIYQPAPTKAQELTEESFLDWLPPLDVALYQASFGYLLTEVQYDVLGYYSDNPRQPYFADPRVRRVVSEFQFALKEIEIRVHKRNEQRPFPYLCQLPSLIPNSISI
ncbi:lipoxygenase family protein [Kangiella marina]|uniref:Lipoxygenase domain-containing protein n=1 Tax=Kangiella marina TaxID=1079178 RepID=A0ABP8IDS6_9GAMM